MISAPDVSNIYEVPMGLASEGLDEQMPRLLRIEAPPATLVAGWPCSELRTPAGRGPHRGRGKYVQLEDAYKSLREALGHGGRPNHHRVVIDWIEAEDIDSPEAAAKALRDVDGILVPGDLENAAVAE